MQYAAMDTVDLTMEDEAEFQPFTLRERIQQLNEIDKKIVQIMGHTSTALGALTIQKPPPNGDDKVDTSSQKETFQTAMDSLITTLHTVDVHMKRQIMGLEEAGIIDLSNDLPDARSRSSAASPKASLKPNAVGSVGNLDVGWLNSRGEKVERNMERELWARGREVLEKAKAGSDVVMQ